MKPIVSCLMLTYNRLTPFKRALQCFLDQTYPNKELIIVNSGSMRYQKKVDGIVNKYSDSAKIKHVKIDNVLKKSIWGLKYGLYTLGELRNFGLDNCFGDYIIVFDDDDWHKEDRIEKQIALCEETDCVDATILRNFQAIYKNKYYNCSILHGLEGTILFRNHKDLKYPDMNQGEDTGFISMLKDRGYKIAIIDEEYNTYRYFFYGTNTVSKEHFQKMISENEGLR